MSHSNPYGWIGSRSRSKKLLLASSDLDRTNFDYLYLSIRLSDLTDSKPFMIVLTSFSNPYGQIGDLWIWAQNWPFCPSLCRSLTIWTLIGDISWSDRPIWLIQSSLYLYWHSFQIHTVRLVISKSELKIDYFALFYADPRSYELWLPVSFDPTVRSDWFKVIHTCIDIIFKSVRLDRWSLRLGLKLTISPFSTPVLDHKTRSAIVSFSDCLIGLIWLTE